MCVNHLCCTAHKKKWHFAYFLHKSTTGSTSTCVLVYFSCTTFRRSATTSATLLIPKCTTPRWTLRCSNYSVAKRQQFSCALSTAASSLKFENVVPEGWIWVFPFCTYMYLSTVILSLLYEHVRVRVMAFFFLFFRVRAAKKQACGTIWYVT